MLTGDVGCQSDPSDRGSNADSRRETGASADFLNIRNMAETKVIETPKSIVEQKHVVFPLGLNMIKEITSDSHHVKQISRTS